MGLRLNRACADDLLLRSREQPRNPLLPTFKTPDLLPELFVVLVLLLFQAFFAVASPTSCVLPLWRESS